VDAVRRGRREEFSDFAWRGEPPDPQSEETFRRSVLDWDARARPAGKAMLRLYGELLRLRRERPALRRPDPARAETSSVGDALWARRWEDGDAVALCINAGAGEAELEPPFPGRWTPLLDTADARFGGPGAGGRAASGRLRVAGRSAVVLGAEEMVGG
jgi:maltooligosyltrehalose trehalohydrolase